MKYLIFILAVCFFVACKYQSQQAKPSVDPSNESLDKMNIIEKFFNNDNWMKVKGNDTSYYYFSRNNLITKVYNYQIKNGDSANTVIMEIKVYNDSLIWNYNDTIRLFLSIANEKKLEWKRLDQNSHDTLYISFNKKDSFHVNALLGNTQFDLTKTLPLSAFLVRSHYDYLHGTRLAFSDTNFTMKKIK